jgi:Domain of unknown function (DUF222)
MSSLPPDVIRQRVCAELAVIDAAQARLRGLSTDLVGNAFRVEVAGRLETQERVTRGLSYRVFGQIADPPDGPQDPGLPPGVKVVDLLRSRLTITAAEVRRRMKVAARITPRRSLTGPPRPPELPALAAAVQAGAVGEEHLRQVCTGLDRLPRDVSPADRDNAEQILVEHAKTQDAVFVAMVGRKLAEVHNPDGFFDEQDRANRRGLVLGAQGVDGMSKLSGYLTPTARAAFEAVAAAVRPGHHVPGSAHPVVDARADRRSKSQRLHDALEWGLGAAMASGRLGTHRGLPVTIIATAALAELEQAAAAAADPSVPMPAPARTGGGSTLPMRDLITLAAGQIHYLAVFDNHSARPLYLGRSRRLASPDQRILCHARDHGCTHPNCAEPGYHCEVNHAVDWAQGGPTDADNLFFACGPANRAAAEGTYTTHITDHGRLAWTDGTGPPEINRLHHPEELLRDDGP